MHDCMAMHLRVIEQMHPLVENHLNSIIAAELVANDYTAFSIFGKVFTTLKDTLSRSITM
jgi:hypothetical protein